jgi:membrane fusion protein (multidrug efflux system)
MIKMKKNVALFTLSMIIASGCQMKEKAQTASDPAKPATGDSTGVNVENVRTLRVEKQKIARTIEYSSSIIAFKEVHLASASPGKIEQISVEIGARVSKGEILVRMDPTQMNQARVNLQNTETDFLRLDTLNKVGGISKQQYDQMKARYDIAKSSFEFLQRNTILKAPFDGVISGKYFEDGELYSGAPNTMAGKAAILSIVQIDPVKAIVNISESYYPLVKTGMDTRVTSDLYPDKTIRGNIIRVYPTLDPASRTFTIEVKIENRQELLRPGMFCRVSLDLGEVDALVVPAVSVLKMQGSNERYVFLEENGIAQRVTVLIGKRFDDKLEVISEKIKEGSNLIVSGQARLVEGDQVRVVTE